MSLRIQKRWTQLGSPQEPGTHAVEGIGKIVDVTREHIETAAALGGNPVVVLGHSESSGLVSQWEILSLSEPPAG